MKFRFSRLAEKVQQTRNNLVEKVPYKWMFFITGLLATIWFFLRVIPKPSRAGYPCMRAAAPLMSGFILYLLSFSGSFFAFRHARQLMAKRRLAASGLLVLAGFVSAGVFLYMNNSKPAYANITVMQEPPDGANNPMGEGQGIFPGRVVWAWNPEATNADCTNEPGNSFWDYQNNDTLIIRNMVDESIIELTGATTFQSAWDQLFRYQNVRKYGEEKSYQTNETIFIKVNQGTTRWVLNQQEKNNGFAWPESGGMSVIQPSWRQAHYAATETGPFVVLNLLRHLVNHAGVPQENIAVGDPMSNIFYHNYSVWHAEFPNVQYIDKFTSQHGRTQIVPAMNPSILYSDKGEIMEEADEALFEIMEEADYLINVACLKSHKHGGITLCAKNHFGSITRAGASHLHPSLISPTGPNQSNSGYGKYRVKVDIMGHKYLGKNTMLFIVEGLFGSGADEVKPPRKWNMYPFNGHWSSSIFMSQDQVALESVCYDFLRTEFDGSNQPESYPNWEGVDDYLHQAADPDKRPEDIVYSPDGKSTFGSLGVHEHWNNHIDMQYNRNLGHDAGIELIRVSGKPVSAQSPTIKDMMGIQVYPNPFTDRMQIAFDTKGPGKLDVRLFDLQGRLVSLLDTRSIESGNQQFSYDLSSLQLVQGIYLLQIHVVYDTGYASQSIRIQKIQ